MPVDHNTCSQVASYQLQDRFVADFPGNAGHENIMPDAVKELGEIHVHGIAITPQ